ncbi:MAG: acyltransferase [Candidatus Omnitrophica bacterium]|nr:acyltransferase [Candidatus Omnitrophota bacterium]
MTIAETYNSKNNSFGFLRIIFAFFVILSHSYFLGGYGIDPLWKFEISFGSIAVEGFFVISGFLIIQSLLNSSSLKYYLWKRFLRIFPAFWVCLFLTSFVLAPLIYYSQNKKFSDFTILSNPFISYAVSNLSLFMKQQTIKGIFMNNPYKEVLNGSLWILFPMFLFYLILPVFNLLELFSKRKKTLLFIFLLLALVNSLEGILFGYYTAYPIQGLARSLFEIQKLFAYFLGGCLIFVFRDKIASNKYFFYSCFLLLFVSIFFRLYNLIGPFLLPYVLVMIATKLPFMSISKNFDLSYGLYIYSFPVQQTIYFINQNIKSPIAFFIFSVIFTLPLAYLNWLLIEKQCFKLKKTYKS